MRARVPLAGGGELVLEDGRLDGHRRALAERTEEPESVRLAYAAAHLVLDAEYRSLGHGLERPGDPAEIAEHVDWERTLAFRRHLDDHGFGIAEAMDTAQRFFIGWPTAERLIRECGRAGLRNGFCAGAGVDHLDRVASKTDLVDAVVFQARAIADAGGVPVLLPMAWLPANGASEGDYVEVYGAILRQLDGPVFVHWLGEMFLPALAGYFPGDSFSRVMALAPEVCRGAKLSMLDDALEVRLRRELLARDQILLTGDDFHFAGLIRGGDVDGPADVAPPVERWTAIADQRVALGDFSHALLGVLDGVAEPAGLALRWLAHGEVERYSELMAPCEAFGREVFRAPTQHYKAGLALVSWLNGRQDELALVNGEERARDLEHYARVAELSSLAGAIGDAGLAEKRLAGLLRSGGDGS